jgi:hypothetical protein
MQTLTRATLLGVTLALTSPLVACKEKVAAAPVQQEVMLNVTTVDLQGKPVESVRFYINGKKFGITDQDGKFVGKYGAKNGDTLTFNVEAPSGYSVPPNPDQSRWQVKIQYPEDGRPLQIDFQAQLQRPERDYLLMVRAGQEGTPVKLNDAIVAKAGPGGDALVEISGVPGTTFVAVAGTAAYKGNFSEDDEVYLLSPSRVGPVADGAPGAPPPPAAEPVPVAAVAPPPVQEPPFPTPQERPVAMAPPPREPDFEPEPARPVAQRPAPTPRDVVFDEPEPDPPAPRVVAAPPPREEEPAIGDLLDDTPPPAPVVAAAPRRPSPPQESPGGLMEGGDTVDPKSAGRAAVAMVGGGPSPAAMSREEIDGRISQIQGSLSSSKVLTKADVDFLGQIDRTHPGYYEAHRLLAEYHFRNKDYKRQAEELEVATSSGKYKRDPTILLSLAKSYAQQQRYSRALSTMQRVDENSRNLPASQKADSYRFYAEMYEFEFMRQYHDDAKKANVSLLDKAITMWERYSTFSKGADPGGVAHAEQKLKKLEEMKNGLEL